MKQCKLTVNNQVILTADIETVVNYYVEMTKFVGDKGQWIQTSAKEVIKYINEHNTFKAISFKDGGVDERITIEYVSDDNVIKFPRAYVNSTVQSNDYSNVLFMENGYIQEHKDKQLVIGLFGDDDDESGVMGF